MDSLIDKLRRLSKNRYFAFLAVLFLAFITALFISLLNRGQYGLNSNINQTDNVNNQSYLQTPSNTNQSPPDNSTATSAKKSVLDTIFESIGINRKSVN